MFSGLKKPKGFCGSFIKNTGKLTKRKMANLVIKHNIKKALPKKMRVSGDVADALNGILQEMLNRAVIRAKANKRKTVMAQDL